MKQTTCFLLAIFFCFIGLGDLNASPGCDPSQPCKGKTTDTSTIKKAQPVLINTQPKQPAQPANKPTAKKDDKKSGGDYDTPLSWRPTFLY